MRKKPLKAIEEHFSKVTDPRKDRTKERKLMDIIAIAINWAGLKSIAMVVSTRIMDGKQSRDARYYIPSLDSDAKRILQKEKTAKGGIHAKQLQAAWNDQYFLKILAAAN